jgi:hypothetical protein
MPERSHVEIRFGKATIKNLSDWTVTQRLSALPDANAQFLFTEAESSKPDYAASVVICEVTGSNQQPLFTGVTDEVEARDGVVKVIFHTDPGLAENRIRGWGFLNVTPQEMFWSTVREAGYKEEQVNTEGWSPGPPEIFEVAVPVVGVTLNRDKLIGDVRFTTASTVRDLASGFTGLDIVDEFTRGPVWALTTVTARTLYDAEQQALLQIDTVLAWLMARARYSYYQLPSQPPRSWRRIWGEAVPDRADAVAVRGLSTQRRWLHAPKLLTAQRTLDLDDVPDMDRPGLPDSLTRQEQLAIASWRRARLTTDQTLAVGALWEALEFYSFDASLPSIFTAGAEAKVMDDAVAGLNAAQEKRIRARLRNLNQTPLPDALTEAFKVDGVLVSPAELRLLRKLREQRNDFVHGRGGTPADPADLRYGLAIVARVLLYRIHRRQRESYSIRM